MVQAFFHWWGRQLSELAPWRALPGGAPRRALMLDAAGPDPAGCTLALRQRRAERPLGRFAADAAGIAALRQALRSRRLPVMLRLPPGALLEREVVLPLAAEREAGAALRHEIERVTPFRPAELFWSWEVTRRDRARGRLHLRLFLVPRAMVDPALALPAAAGSPVAWLEGRGADGTWRRIAVTDTAWRPWQRRVLHTALFLCAALAVGVVVTPFLRQSLQQAEVEARIAALRPLLQEADALRQRLAQDAASGDAVAAAQAEFGQALGALAALTTLLPDDTYLTDVSMKQRQLTLRGHSANAARLIATLSADPAIRNPAFAAPVTRAPEGGTDLFTIAAEAVP